MMSAKIDLKIRRQIRRLERELDDVVMLAEHPKAGAKKDKLIEKAEGVRALLATYEQIEERNAVVSDAGK